jgi:hypothetical protein
MVDLPILGGIKYKKYTIGIDQKILITPRHTTNSGPLSASLPELTVALFCAASVLR